MTLQQWFPNRQWVDLGACLEGIYDRPSTASTSATVDLGACLEQVLLAVNF